MAYEILQKYHVDVEELIYLLQEKSAFETPLDQISTLVNINKKVKNKKYKKNCKKSVDIPVKLW